MVWTCKVAYLNHRCKGLGEPCAIQGDMNEPGRASSVHGTVNYLRIVPRYRTKPCQTLWIDRPPFLLPKLPCGAATHPPTVHAGVVHDGQTFDFE